MPYPLSTETEVVLERPVADVLIERQLAGSGRTVYVSPHTTSEGLNVAGSEAFYSDLPGSSRGANGGREILVLLKGTRKPVMVYASSVRGLEPLGPVAHFPQFNQFY
jgi:hypothetical protein